MGKGYCCACGTKLGIKGVMLKGGVYTCYDCVKASGHNPLTWMGNMKTSAEEFKQMIADNANQNKSGAKRIGTNTFNLRRDADFHVTKTVGNIVKLDEENRLWYAQDMFGLHKSAIHSFDDILDFELLEDGDSVTKGGMAGATVGALAFGATGAIVGSITGKKTTKMNCTSMRIKVTLNDMSNPIEYIDLIRTNTSRNSSMYKTAMKQAQEILSLMQIICKSRTNGKPQQNVSVADEIKKLKELQEQGVITAEEFENQKNKLLSL
jgi:hypothetical protein